MIPIKIQCGCGQRYAFETEPVDGRLPTTVACPVCGTDGTEAANAAISQSVGFQPNPAAVRGGPLRVTLSEHPESAGTAAEPAPAAARYRPTLMPGQIDRPQAEVEARAKISWGDPPTEVIKFLMMNGFTAQEATAVVQEMFAERAATIRKNGFVKIVLGSVLVCVPIAFYITCASVGIIPMKLFALTIMVGLYGAYTLLKGIIMVVAPKSEPGDVATQ
jgi:hypothetical protein